MAYKINKIAINNITYNVVDGGTKCKDCIVNSICRVDGFLHGVSFDCNSVHLELERSNREGTLPNPPDVIELSQNIVNALYGAAPESV